MILYSPPSMRPGASLMQALRTEDPAMVGPFRLLVRLGAGGMGQVYLGERSGELAAVKIVYESHAGDQSFRVRFVPRHLRAADAGWAATVAASGTDAVPREGSGRAADRHRACAQPRPSWRVFGCHAAGNPGRPWPLGWRRSPTLALRERIRAAPRPSTSRPAHRTCRTTCIHRGDHIAAALCRSFSVSTSLAEALDDSVSRTR
jgi:hypothetical protein